MEYKIAEKLREGGFPQGTYNNSDRMYIGRDPWQIPTLDELIEACGTDFRGIERGDWVQNDGKSFWYAKSVDEIIVDGSTREDAVANLWLALHEK